MISPDLSLIQLIPICILSEPIGENKQNVTLTVLYMDYGPSLIHGVVIGKAKPPCKTVVPVPGAACRATAEHAAHGKVN